MQFYTFSLPVKKHIRKYLTARYGDTIQVCMENEIGFVVLNTIASRLEAKVSRGYVDLFNNRHNDAISFIIPWHYFYLTKKQVSPYTATLLNRYFETKFEEELCNHVQLAGRFDIKIKTAIDQFCQQFNIEIEEDISFEALKKMEYRSRQKKGEKNIRSLSPQNSMFKTAS